MNHELHLAVRERHLDLQFEELSGRASPRDQTDAVLARVSAAPRLASPRRSRIAAAALALAGLAATLGVAFLQPGAPPAGEGKATPAAPVQQPLAQPAPTNAPTPADHQFGHSAADLRAQRSAEAMLAAERTLAARRQANPGNHTDRQLGFEELSSWPYRNGLEGMPGAIRALDGQRVTMLGFVLPLDEVTGMREFLLVQSLWACCYGTPPDLTGIVRVVLPEGQTLDWSGEPFEVRGVFRVAERRAEGYCTDIYQLDATSWAVVE